MAIQGPNFILPQKYKKLSLGFIVISVLILAAVIYLSWSRVIIIIHPNLEKINQEFIFNIRPGVEAGSSDDSITGKVLTAIVEETQTFAATGSKDQQFESNAVGSVIITNSSSKSQALVATTRLAYASDPKKTILRIKDNVEVPAGGQAKVSVYAETAESFVDIAAGSKFIIPGLWQGLWDKIYAQNDQILTKNSRTINFVTETDLSNAQNQLQEALYQKSLTAITGQLQSKEALWPRIATYKIIEVAPSAKVNDEVSEFSLKIKLQGVAVVFDESQLVSLAENKITQSLSADKKLIDLDAKSFNYALQNYNCDNNNAVIKVTLAGNSAIKNDSKLLDKSKLLGKTSLEIKSYFSQFSEVKSVDVNFQPVWVTKTPNSAGKIEVKISGN
ncbi:MAG: hypothetical protein WCX71_02765 [Candidatus Buchananbacteria bacterium]